MVNFYPSISSKLLDKALDWASSIVKISKKDTHIIMDAKKSLLYKDGNPWKKKGVSHFDVTGLFRDDGLGDINPRPWQIENIKKIICEVFKNMLQNLLNLVN